MASAAAQVLRSRVSHNPATPHLRTCDDTRGQEPRSGSSIVRYFVDTEFNESSVHEPIELISIGIVGGDGRTLYLINSSFELSRVNDWVAAHVVPKLPPRDERWRSHAAIRDAVQAFVGDDPAPEFWAYCAAYDWVVLCQLFNTMAERPLGWPIYCRDVRQEADRLGVDLKSVIPERDTHDALADALWCRDAWRHLANLDPQSRLLS